MARVSCVVDPESERRDVLAHRAGAHACAELEAALGRHAGAEVIDVCVPTPAHLEVLAAIPAGGHLVVMEKPLGRDPDEAAAVARTARERGLAMFAAQVLRFFPAYRRLHDLVLARGAGAVGHVRMRRVGPPPVGLGGWFLDEERSGGIFVDLMIHDLDWLVWTFGPPERLAARSGGGRHAVAVLSWPGRRVAHLEASWMHRGPFTTAAELDADWGSVSLDGEAGGLRAFAAEGATLSTPRLKGPYLLELEAAWRAHARGEEPPVAPEDGVRAVRLAALCRESARLGQPLAVDLAVGL